LQRGQRDVTTAQDLFNDYNRYRFHTTSIKEKRAGGAYITSLKPTPKNLLAFEKLVGWCGERSIDARHWLYTLFVARHWRFAPPLKHLTSPTHLDRYQSMEAAGYQQAQVASRDHQGFDCNRDLSHSVEMLKRHLLQFGGPGRCMDKMTTETYGYHPLSKVCEGCPAAVACEAMLQSRVKFDITALRRGAITPYQAQVAVSHAGR